MLFNTYYINFPKVYEIKMMMSNVIQTGSTIESNDEGKTDAELKAKMGAKFLNFFNSEIGSSLKSSSSDSQKVLETFEVKTTKSVVLNEVIARSKIIENFSNVKEGTLIRIDNIKLKLVNEDELRTVKMFLSGAFKDATIPQMEGIDINNALNSMFKDYAYKLKGSIEELDINKVSNTKNELIIKIPLTFENEFESLYSVDDLFIGKVTIIGIYKGKTKIGSLKNSFEFFQQIGQAGAQVNSEEIRNSQYLETKERIMPENIENNEYNYIDILAIVQNIEIQD